MIIPCTVKKNPQAIPQYCGIQNIPDVVFPLTTIIRGGAAEGIRVNSFQQGGVNNCMSSENTWKLLVKLGPQFYMGPSNSGPTYKKDELSNIMGQTNTVPSPKVHSWLQIST